MVLHRETHNVNRFKSRDTLPCSYTPILLYAPITYSAVIELMKSSCGSTESTKSSTIRRCLENTVLSTLRLNGYGEICQIFFTWLHIYGRPTISIVFSSYERRCLICWRSFILLPRYLIMKSKSQCRRHPD